MSSRDTRSSTSDQVPFLEEWKAKRERMRLKSSSSSCSGAGEVHSPGPYSPKETKSPVSPKCHQTPVQAQSETLQKVLDPGHRGNVVAEPNRVGLFSGEMDNVRNESQASHGKEKRGSGQRKTRTQIEKRKLREKRRPTGVVNISLESFEDAEDAADQELASAPQTQEPSTKWRTSENQDMTRTPYSRQKSGSAGSLHAPLIKKSSGNHPKFSSLQDKEHNSGTKSEYSSIQLEKMNELQQAVSGEKMENQKLKQQLKEKDGSIQVLRLQMISLREDLDGAKDENRKLKEEHQTLLRVVGQLSS
ncbi:PRKC apoptosis WT1 regulator protein-like isoform X2 [Pleurodeles waltl]|uniref:PRKC apoptosis WT1 regulator protein-like isoform X2 n=1 Tax=Pleurodeles waltl TaxID=8319 RepID=UPI003709713F